MSSQWGAYASSSASTGLNPGAWGGQRAPPFPVAATCPTVAWSGELYGQQPQMPRLSCTVWNPPPPTNVIWKPFENRRYVGNFSLCNSGPAGSAAAVQSLGSNFSDNNMAVQGNYYNPVSITPPPGFHQAMGRNDFVPASSYPRNLSIQPPPPTLPPFRQRNSFDDPVAQPQFPSYKRDSFGDPATQPLSQRWEFMGEPWKKKRGGKKRGKNKESACGGVSTGMGDGVGGGNVGISAVGAETAAQFVCEPCSKEYKTEETYRAHISAHKKCTTCDFMAVPSVLREHELMHILPPELNFTSPEEIRSWREKRRKNYPTAANVAKKRRLEADRQARGEVAETPLYKYVSRIIGEDIAPGSRGRGGGRGGKKPRLAPYQQRRKQQQFRSQQESSNEVPHTHSRITQSQSTFITPAERVDNSRVGGTLAAMEAEGRPNGTSSPPLEAANEDCVDAGDTVESQRGEVHDLERGSGENLLGAIVADVSSQQAPRQSAKDRRKRWKKPRRRMQQKPWSKRKDRWVVLSEVGERKPTLLEKLLAPEIRKEQNAILQCIRHTVQENFFMPPITGSRNEPSSQDGETSNSEEREQEDGLQTLEDVTVAVPVQEDGPKVDVPVRIKVEDSVGEQKGGGGCLPSKDRHDDQEQKVTEEDFCWIDEYQNPDHMYHSS